MATQLTAILSYYVTFHWLPFSYTGLPACLLDISITYSIHLDKVIALDKQELIICKILLHSSRQYPNSRARLITPARPCAR